MFDTHNTPHTFAIGGDMNVNRIGFGAMRLTGQPGNFGPYADWDAGVELLCGGHAMGVTFFDSARSYGPEWSDKILGDALGGTDAILATKGGVDKPAPDRISVDGSADTLRKQVEDAIVNFRRSQIDLFQLHRVDPNTPIETSVEALAQMQSEGLIRHIGLSNVDQAQLDRAMTVAPIASVQNRFNVAERGMDAMVDFTAAHDIAFIPYPKVSRCDCRPWRTCRHPAPKECQTVEAHERGRYRSKRGSASVPIFGQGVVATIDRIPPPEPR